MQRPFRLLFVLLIVAPWCGSARAAPTQDDPLALSPAAAVAQPGVRSFGDIMRAQAAFEKTMNGPGATDQGPLAQLGSGLQCAKKLIDRRRIDGKIDPELLTERSQQFLETDRGREWLSDLLRLEADTWYTDWADGYFVDDAIASMIVVYVRKPVSRPKTVRAVTMIRQGDNWKVSLDAKADAAELGAEVKAAWEKLHRVTEARQKGCVAFLSRPLDKPLPLEGCYIAHWQQSDTLLCFTSRGEVTLYTKHSGGTSSMGTYDYHVAGNDVTIENRLPLRLKIDHERSQTVNGRKYYALILPNSQQLYFEAKAEPMYLQPLKKNDGVISRPPAGAEE